jgi:pilus assembly protein CpaF
LEKDNKITVITPPADTEQIRRLIQKMVADVDRRVNYKDPIVDARLKNGARINVVMQPIGLEGPYLTIRKFRQDLLSLDALKSLRMIDENLELFLKGAVKARLNLFISGGTSTGKTTMLNCLCRHVPNHERVISIEDSAELNLASIENLVRLETRPKTSGSHLEVPMSELIRAALRMRPDRMIVGEIRGSEAYDMLQALNTGHAGSMSTGHGNSAADMLDRIETMALLSEHATSEGVRRQIASGIQLVIHLRKNSDGTRKIGEVLRVKGYDKGSMVCQYVISDDFKIEDQSYFEWVCQHDQINAHSG